MEDIGMELSERIQIARERAEMSNEQVCEALSIDQSDLDAWETGEQEPSLAQITKMCELFQVSSEYLLFGKDSEGKFATKYCTKCREELPSGVKYCPQCGQKIQRPKSDISQTRKTPAKQDRTFSPGKSYTIIIRTDLDHWDDTLYGIQQFFESGGYDQNGVLTDGKCISQCSAEEIEDAQAHLQDILCRDLIAILCRNMSYDNALKVLEVFSNRATVYIYYDEDGTALSQLMKGTPVESCELEQTDDPYAILEQEDDAAYKTPKDKWISFLLCLFLGGIGAHKFYEGKIGMGILYLFTGGLFLIGAIIDLLIILTKPNPYYV